MTTARALAILALLTLATFVAGCSGGGGASTASSPSTQAVVLTRVQVGPAGAALAVGTTGQFSATALFSDGSTRDVTSEATWSSSAGTVATIDAGGLATARNIGQTTIGATLQGLEGQAVLTVTAATLVGIQVTPGSASIAAGTTQVFVASGAFSDGSEQDLSSSVSWSTSDAAVATISNAPGSKGLATGVSAGGPVTVTAALGGVTGTAQLTVSAAVLSSIRVTPATSSVPMGRVQQLAATGVFSDGSEQDLTAQVDWASSDTALATVDATGVARGVGQGLATVTATDAASGVGGSALVQVTSALLESVEVTPAAPCMPAGRQQQLTATGSFSDGTSRDLTFQVTWTSSDPSVDVSNATGSWGLAAGLLPGQAEVTATDPSTGVHGSTTVTVTAPVLVSLQVTPANAVLSMGRTRQFTATGTYSDGSTQDLTGQVDWTSSDTAVATVSTAGLARGVREGLATLTVTDAASGLDASAPVQVTSAVLESLQVAPDAPSLPRGRQRQLTATGTFSDGTSRDLTFQVVWTSSDPSVEVGPWGLATGAQTGLAEVTATDPSTGVHDSTTVTVTAAVLASLQVTPAQAVVALGRSQQFTATGTFSDGSSQDLTTQVGWTSSDSAVTTVGAATGLASTHGMGAATLTAVDAQTGLQATAGLTVLPAVLASIQVTPVDQTMLQGDTQQYTATGTFTNGATQDMTGLVNWTSSDPAQATVSASGLATALSATYGTVTLTATDPATGIQGAATLYLNLGASWTGRTSGVSVNLNGAAFGAGTFVAVGNVGTVLTSPDGETWTVRTSGTSLNLNGAAFGNGTFVMVGNSGAVRTSPDGITWTGRTSGTGLNLNAVSFGNGLFVAVGDNGVLLTSPDGIDWSGRDSGTSLNLNGVTFGNGRFVAVGNAGVMLYSDDGVDWSTAIAATGLNLNGVAAGNGVYVAVGNSGVILTSGDGFSWNHQSSGTASTIQDVVFGNGTFVAVGNGGLVAASGDAGVTWGLPDSGTTLTLNGVAFGAGTVVAVGNVGTIRTSP